MTQNVKKSRGGSLTGRGFVALSWLAWLVLGSAGGPVGCASDGSKPSADCQGGECAPSGRFSACAVSSQCDEAHGFSCIEGECSYECQSHADCVGVGHCASRSVDGQRQTYCVRDDAPPTPGQLYTSCPHGTECADNVLCLGAGPGDLDAYCSIDCSRDDDCAAGYYCGILTRPPCAKACGVAAQPNNERCVPADQIGAGKAFECGSSGVERRVCRQREFCAPCASDTDCLAVPNQICARDAGGEKICTRLCDPDARSCPWGNAAECDTFDAEVGAPTCSHRFGSCSGSGQTCEPCRTNADCPGGACVASSFTGERWCVNFATTCECKDGVDASGTCSNGGCPDSPSGLPLQCVGAADSSLLDICYAANSATQTLLGSSPQTGCWGPH